MVCHNLISAPQIVLRLWRSGRGSSLDVMAFVPNAGGLPFIASKKSSSVSRRECAKWRMSRPESEQSRTRREVLLSAFGAVAAAISGDFLRQRELCTLQT